MKVGNGYVRGVTFEDIFLDSVKNPIIIDQNYCKVSGACEELVTKLTLATVSSCMILVKTISIVISDLFICVCTIYGYSLLVFT